MKKEIILAIIMAIIIVVLAGILLWPVGKPSENGQEPPKTGLNITSVERIDNNNISDIKVRGYVNGDNWVAFEAQVGVVKFLDEDNNEIGYALMTTVGDWMVPPPVNFQAQVRMTPQEADRIKTLFFRNENPSGDPERERTLIMTFDPAVLKDTIVLQAYFNNSNFDPEASCNKVFPVGRTVAKTQTVARAALEELLGGPTPAETDAKYFTSINNGVKIQSLTIENGVAKVDFDEQLEFQVGGSCRVSAIRAQITQTLKQFPTVSSVVISIDGRIEDILQP